MVSNHTHKENLKACVNALGFDKVLEELADLAYYRGDQISLSDKTRSRNYHHLAVDLEPAIKSAIERGL